MTETHAARAIRLINQLVWKRCNPALGDFRSLEEMQIAAARAKEIPGT